MTGAGGAPGRVFGVLVTYRRPRALATMLDRLAAQDLALEGLVLVDNAAAPETPAIVRAHGAAIPRLDLVTPGENLGSVGGFALGMERVLSRADDRDWMLLLDDDDPPPAGAPRFLADLAAVGDRLAAQDPATGAVGTGGAWLDPARGRLRRVEDHELAPAVPVDCLANGLFPLYRTGAVRATGAQDRRLFFGFGEVEYGLRLRRAGLRLYLAGDACRERRARRPRSPDEAGAPGRAAGWRRYYGVRNLVHILRAAGRPDGALRVTMRQGVLGPLLRPGPGEPRRRGLGLVLRGARDGWRGRLGRVVEPAPVVKR